MDDLISRKMAIGCLGNSPEEMCMPWSEVERMLRALPAVDATPVAHGYWVERLVVHTEETAIDAWQSAKCPKCMKYHTTPYLYYFTDYAYCPNCGAKMDGERRNDNEIDRRGRAERSDEL